MFTTNFYWDYQPLHQSSVELVLCGLVRNLLVALEEICKFCVLKKGIKKKKNAGDL